MAAVSPPASGGIDDVFPAWRKNSIRVCPVTSPVNGGGGGATMAKQEAAPRRLSRVMNSILPKRSFIPGWRGCWRLPIWSLTGSCSSTRSRPLPGVPTVGVSTLGDPGPMSKLSLRVPAQMGRRETETQGGKSVRGNRDLVLSYAQGGCTCSRGLQAFARERERGRETARQPVLPRGHLFVRGPWTFLL
jgi:hypothetical protein